MIILRNRAHYYMWSTDIKKMYNQLKMNKTSLRFQLLLFKDSLKVTEEPEEWLLLSAWYGVVTTGNQANHAIDLLIKEFGEELPNAAHALSQFRYVDDITPGADTEEEREQQISEVHHMLDMAGFAGKFTARSGQPPPEGATADNRTLKVLGYKLDLQEDNLKPGLGDLNMNRKRVE